MFVVCGLEWWSDDNLANYQIGRISVDEDGEFCSYQEKDLELFELMQ